MIENLDNLKNNLLECKFKFESLQLLMNSSLNKLSQLDNEIKKQKDNLINLIEHKQYYKKAIDIVYERSIQELKDVINSGLTYIFKDKSLTVDIQLSDKRGKSLNFIITHNDKKVNLKRGMGMGVKCVISAILHIYYLQCKNSKILMLDEAYSNISKEYIADFFGFLSKLCKKLGFKFILITHDERFVDYADKVYNIANGKVCLIKNESN